jgi:two-component system OmpR family response regulator
MTTPVSIALVEDDPDIATLAQIALVEMGGFAVRHFGSGPELLTDRDGPLPDLYLLDYRLPDMTGEELLGKLRADPRTAAIPAIFMTASLMPDRIKALKDVGALDVIAKPFDPLTLADQVRNLLDRA